MGHMKERATISNEIQQCVKDWTQFIDADDLVGNMVMSFVLAHEDEIIDLVQEKQRGEFYVAKKIEG